MIKLLTIIGARPQIIKAAALSRAMHEGFKDQIHEVILHTGQHYDDALSEVFFREMHIPSPDYNLGIGSAGHGSQTGQMIGGIEEVLLKEKPDGLVVYGDTNSTLAGALAAAKLHIPVIHIEAGLRSFNKRMPEEINRIACDHMSTFLFSPTLTGIENLAKEGIMHHQNQSLSSDHPGVYHSGDVMYDNTLFFRELAMDKSPILKNLGLDNQNYILATIHRPSNTDIPENLAGIFRAMDEISKEKNIPIVLPLHPRTAAILQQEHMQERMEFISSNRLIRLLPAVSFLDMIRLEAGAKLILTDSGGVQKEAWFMEKPVVVLRKETEWVEIVEAGKGVLTGPDTDKIIQSAKMFLEAEPGAYPPIFGDGKAARQILKVLTTANWQ
ncbi:MAG: UDP-N-acetylglucosamine 2-epimerase (non-hydrolyzing) [Bacteroidales bacterium]|nr:UDP-N-acetylglucosamine 2-epimerase (non-hydrolyzing) [Bacteroidales bacterium]